MLPCDRNGVCINCKVQPSLEEILTCSSCIIPWHNVCLPPPLLSFATLSHWLCPDCSDLHVSNTPEIPVPEEPYTTHRAKKPGKANACSGRILVTAPADHLGPIGPEYDPVRRLGVCVGDCWADRLECRQWGAHFPHIAGIAGQARFGAQSVALSGGYLDDEDHGNWFLYTGSGGRDLSGNRRTSKKQAFDQKFEKANEALRVSCLKGYPVRVVRSHKEKRSMYAPQKGIRYDGVYRIETCWRKVGTDGFRICRYLFVRCDNEPAPWSSDETGDKPRPLPPVKELDFATDVTLRKESPAWDYDESEACWKWVKPPPESQKAARPSRIGHKREIKSLDTIVVEERLPHDCPTDDRESVAPQRTLKMGRRWVAAMDSVDVLPSD